MKDIKISIVIPVYNVEKYIEECLQSVFEQTMQEGVECILVDDCSPDNSIEIAQKAIYDYNGTIKFNILHHERNGGLSAARNTGTKNAKGQYLYYLDSDDKLYPHCLEELYLLANKYPSAQIIQGSTYPNFLLSKKNVPEYSENVEWIRKSFCTFIISDPAWNKLVKRDFIINNNLFFAEGYLQEDTIWAYHLQKKVTNIAFCKTPTYWYRYNPEGIMHGIGIEKEARSFARVFNFVLGEIIQCKQIEPYEIQYLEFNAVRVIKLVGFDKGIELLAIQNNPYFYELIKESYNITSKRSKYLVGKVICKIIRFSLSFKLYRMRRVLCDIEKLKLNVNLNELN